MSQKCAASVCLFLLLAHAVEALNGKVWHISDMHLDLYYATGSPANCLPEYYNDELCCRANSPPEVPHRAAGKYGDHNCDSPLALLEALFQAWNYTYEMLPWNERPDFIVWTGDNDNHHKRNQSEDVDLTALRTATGLFNQYLPELSVFPCLGNLDTYPDDELSLPPGQAWLTDVAAEYWARWLPSWSLETLRKGGYYSHHAIPGLRIVALNTLGDYKGMVDAADQWSWFNTTLSFARQAGERVWIIGHIDPEFWDQERAAIFQNIIANYTDVVANLLWGHTHADQFNLLRANGTGEVIMVNLLTPSVEPAWTQPSYRVYDYNLTSMSIVEIYAYTANIDAMNNGTAHLPYFNHTYTFREEYGMTDLTNMTQWAHFTERMFTDDALFQRYAYNFHAGYEYVNNCTGTCQLSSVCQCAYMLESARLNCVGAALRDQS